MTDETDESQSSPSSVRQKQDEVVLPAVADRNLNITMDDRFSDWIYPRATGKRGGGDPGASGNYFPQEEANE